MLRSLTVTAITLALSAATFGQTNGRRSAPSKTEVELIALSRLFVETSIGKEMVEVTDKTVPSPHGPMLVAEARGQWESVELEDVNLFVRGNEAEVTGHVVFKGHSPSGESLAASSDLRIKYFNESGHWKYVNGCLGACDSK